MPTAIIQLLLEIVKIAMEGQPPEVKAELWRLYLEDLKEWRAFWKQFKPEDADRK